MAIPKTAGGAYHGAAPSTVSSPVSGGGGGGGVADPGAQGISTTPAPDEPHSNLPFDQRMMRHNLYPNQPNVTSGVITTDVGSGGVPRKWGDFYCFFLFNPAEIDADYSFDLTINGMLPPVSLSPAAQSAAGGGGVLTQTVSFNLLFDRTYEVWSGYAANMLGASKLPSSSMVGFAQPHGAAFPKNGGPYRFGVLWDVWALERICGIYRQADGVHPDGPPFPAVVHVQTGGVSVANTISAAQQNDFQRADLTTIDHPAAPSALDFFGWFTTFSVQYTRFDANMTPTRCTVSLGFQLTYVTPNLTPNPAPSGS